MELKDIFFIEEKDWYTLQAWAKLAYDKDKNEISGLMTAVPQKDGRIKVGDVEILKQENTGTNTDLDGDAVAEYTMKYAMKYNNPSMKFVWWHSHHTMGAFWSGTDTNEIEAWKNTSYSLALVINLKEEYLFRVSFWRVNGLPVEQHIDTTLTIERKEPKINITKEMKAQYKELCSNKTTQVFGGYKGYQQSIWQNNMIQKQETELEHEEAYYKTVDSLTKLQEEYLDGTCKYNQFNKEIKKLDEDCKKSKYPFTIKSMKRFNKLELQQYLMSVFPAELLEWQDNTQKDIYETADWQREGGWYGV